MTVLNSPTPGVANLSPILSALARAGVPVNANLDVVHIESSTLTAVYRTALGDKTLTFQLVRE